MKNHYDSAPADSKPSKPMKGFDPEFSDIVDYILRITYRIWEGKQVGLCYDYYSEDCPVYTLAGMSAGAEEVTQNTLNTLSAFPDRTLAAANVIWGGNEEQGFHTSHLIDTQMTAMGDSEFGSASGKNAKIQVIAHCVIKDNKIIEEWLVRDNYSLAEQLGSNPIQLAEQLAIKPEQKRYTEWKNNELKRLSEQDSAIQAIPGSDIEKTVMEKLDNIWNKRMIGDVKLLYSPIANFHGSANRELTGHESIERFYIDFLGSLSNLKMSFDYICSIPSNKNGVTDIAIRWTMSGNHNGSRLFGTPCNEPILVIGESQYTIKDGKVIEEWTVFDQLAILTQIARIRNSKKPKSVSRDWRHFAYGESNTEQ